MSFKELSVKDLANLGVAANDGLFEDELEKAKEILRNIHQKTKEGIEKGRGPFYAEIYDKEGNLVAGASNSVVEDECALCHAEINTLRLAHRKFGAYSLAKEDLTLYINAEPCVMCMGAIMWSGVKRVFFSVPTEDVEKITGFDEGFKPDWIEEFKKRGIQVYGNIEAELGKNVLRHYIETGCKVYRPRED